MTTDREKSTHVYSWSFSVTCAVFLILASQFFSIFFMTQIVNRIVISACKIGYWRKCSPYYKLVIGYWRKCSPYYKLVIGYWRKCSPYYKLVIGYWRKCSPTISW